MNGCACVCPCVCPCVCLCLYLYLCLCVYLSIWLSDYRFVCLHAHQSVLDPSADTLQTTGAAYVGARCGICCQPRGVFFSISVDKQMWILSDGLHIDNFEYHLASGPYNVSSNAWYSLTLSVIGTSVNAWVGSDQVRHTVL
jgi:hypothetical protein